MSATAALETEDRPLAESLKPLLEQARQERGEVHNQARALRDKAHEAENAVKARQHDLDFLDSLIKECGEDSKRLPEYQRLREAHVNGSARLEQQATDRRAAAGAFDERIAALDREIKLLEQGQGTPAKSGRN